jgi:hypothetical protein
MLPLARDVMEQMAQETSFGHGPTQDIEVFLFNVRIHIAAAGWGLDDAKNRERIRGSVILLLKEKLQRLSTNLTISLATSSGASTQCQ